jgi:hypothetical protein
MRRVRLVLGLMALCLLLALAGCGTEELIETSAVAMNLEASDLGSGWSQMGGDMGVADMPAADVPYVEEFNMRMFGRELSMEMVITMVFRIQDVDSARQEMASGAVEQIASDLETQVPGATMMRMDPPDVGDEETMVGGTHSDIGLNLYVIAFRKANVIGMLMVMGDASSIDEAVAAGLAEAMEAKFH